ncbi:heterokaryon incompatibility protein [Colletotrichum eremochloae]|nr:heterokaryon incompatibility protein [Colletotrichum eremochloae]
MNICDFCQRNVLESKKVWDYHHTSAVAFKDAANSGCVICKRLAESVGDPEPWFTNNISALYRWNMHETPQAIGCKSHVAITFRPLPGGQHGEKNSESLPEHLFYLIPEDDLGSIPNEEILGSGTDSEASFTQMKTWLNHCKENHPRCKPRHSSRNFMPTRVLDVGVPRSPWPPTHIRVVNTREQNIKEQYMTLSHCWGKKEFVKLTDGNFNEFTTRGIPWKSYDGNDICSNKNFEEAIEVTRKLGVRYIWIDSICIIQDQPLEEDWKAEAKLMHKVYRNSYCNLAAAVSEDSSGGLFRARNSDVLPVKYTPEGPSHIFSSRSWRILPSDLWDNDLLGSHLYTRGWVFQERMLSPRLLQFGKDQVFWDCATISACETLPAGLPPSLDNKAGVDRHWRQRLQEAAVTVPSLVKTAEGSPTKFWESAVRAYTSCKLTQHRDKGSAMWGIAKLVRDMEGEEYAHGLWSTRLEEQLAWQVAGEPAVKYPEVDWLLFPTWSWTCLDVPIQVAPRAPGVSRFYTATDHKGGPVAFRFEEVLRRSMVREGISSWRDVPQYMAKRLSDADKERVKAQDKLAKKPNTGLGGNRGNPDIPSKLLSEEIEICGHICKGILRAVPEEKRWVIDIEGVRAEAIIEAYPDIQPSKDEMPCEFLVLAVSRGFTYDYGQEYSDTEDDESNEMRDIRYSGIGIMVKRARGNNLRRVGAVKFRQVDWDDWYQFRLACGEDKEALNDEKLNVENGQKVWLV